MNEDYTISDLREKISSELDAGAFESHVSSRGSRGAYVEPHESYIKTPNNSNRLGTTASFMPTAFQFTDSRNSCYWQLSCYQLHTCSWTQER